jgi:hypothetical protein
VYFFDPGLNLPIAALPEGFRDHGGDCKNRLEGMRNYAALAGGSASTE